MSVYGYTKKLFYLSILLFLSSCNQPNVQIEKRTHFDNGNLRSVYHENEKGEMDGSMTINYENGNTKSTATFSNGKLIGVRIYYKNNDENTLDLISLEINDSLRHVTVFHENEVRGQEGYQLWQRRVGKWYLYNDDGILTDSINYGSEVPHFNL